MAALARVALAAALARAAAAPARVVVSSVEILELDQLRPDTTIGHAVPTGWLAVDKLRGLNLLVWARNATEAVLATATSLTSDPSRQLSEIVAMLQRRLDPDLTAHVCAHDVTGTCDIRLGPTEDKNRYLDLKLRYQLGAKAGGVRVVVAEDAAKAVDYPLSFNVRVDALRVRGAEQRRSYIGRNLAQVVAGRSLDADGLDWASSGLVDLIVSTTRSWPWTCARRLASNGDDFQAALRRAIVAFEGAATGRWSVSFSSSISAQTGIALVVQYALCGHLMQIPVAIQSSPSAPDSPLMIV